jgi:4-amino-4-deoxy-L-arabinose transferase-like glycosyltransferase
MSKESLFLKSIFRNPTMFQQYLTPAILLGLILLLGTALRFYDLGSESYMSDEMYTVLEAQQSIHQLITSGRLDQPPAYYLPLLLWVKIFGANEVSTRSFSALSGIGSIVLIYLIGRALFDRRVGLFGAFLLAISGIQIYYSQTARFYSFYEFTTLLSFLFFILALQSNRIIHYILYSVTSLLMVYSHAFGIFILVAQNLIFILQRKKDRNVIIIWLFCQLLIMFAIIPYFYPIAFGANSVDAALSNTTVDSQPPLWEPLITFSKFIIPFRFDRSWGIMIANYFASIAFLVIGTWIFSNQQGKNNWMAAARGLVSIGNLQGVPKVRRNLLLVSCWLLCPIILPFILSWVVAPIYHYRYMIGAAPAFYLLIALGMLNIRKMVPLIVSLGALLVLVVPGLYYYYVSDVKDQWREVVSYVGENSRPNDVIVFPNDEGRGNNDGIQRESFYWYYQGNLQSCSVNIRPLDPEMILKPLMQCLSKYERFWLISLTFDPAVNERIKTFFLNPNQTSMHLLKEQQFVGISVYLFELIK